MCIRDSYITMFDASTNCRLEEPGASAKVYWIWRTNFCTPIYLHGKETKTYYRFTSNGSLLFECYDPKCLSCQYKEVEIDLSKRQCTNLTNSTGLKQSLLGGEYIHHGQPYIYSWQSIYGNTSIIANVFFTNMFCMFHPRYIEPQLLSSHINLGIEKTDKCVKTSTGQYIRNRIDSYKTNNTLVIRRAHWECIEDCYECQFKLSNVGLSNCHDYRHNIKVIFTRTIDEIQLENLTWTLTEQSTIYVSIGCSLVFAAIFGVVTMLVYLKNSCLLYTSDAADE